MKRKIILTIFVSVLLVSCGPAEGDGLQASGLIEATEISVSPEMSGKVIEVYAVEGDSVTAGEPILRIEDELGTSARYAGRDAFPNIKRSL